jgi:hypothetical protein
MVFTGFCLFLPDERVTVLASGGGPTDPDLGAVDDAGRPARAEVVDDLGQRPQPHVGADGAASLGEQGPHLTDGPSDGGAVHAEPAGQHVMGDPVTKMDERGQQPVYGHQPVLRAGAHGPPSRPGGKPRLVTLLPQRPDLVDEFSDRFGRQACDPPITDDHRTRRVPHHPTMINHPDSTSHRSPCTSS